MKFLFSISGIGLGHTIRQKAIIDELKRREEDSEIVVFGYKNSYNYFKKRFKTYDILGHSFSGNKCETSSFNIIIDNFFYIFIFFIDFFNVFFRMLFIRPNLVIVDGDPVVVLASKLAFRKIVYVYNYDLNEVKFVKRKIHAQRGFFWVVLKLVYKLSSKVIIPVLTQEKRVEGKINYVSQIIREKEKELKLKKKPILISTGGSDFGVDFVDHILEVADEFNEDFIVFGLDRKDKKNVKFFKFSEDFLDYLKLSKGLICLAGHNTLSEALFFKKAILVFYIKGLIEHEQNINLVKDYVMVGDNCGDFKEILKNYLNNIKLLENKVKKLDLKGDGAKQAVDIILSLK